MFIDIPNNVVLQVSCIAIHSPLSTIPHVLLNTLPFISSVMGKDITISCVVVGWFHSRNSKKIRVRSTS
jgi:hypothetical protein